MWRDVAVCVCLLACVWRRGALCGSVVRGRGEARVGGILKLEYWASCVFVLQPLLRLGGGSCVSGFTRVLHAFFVLRGL